MSEMNHDHEHGHDHGPDCACGCHDHDHDHDHHHEHAELRSIDFANFSAQFESHVHDQASTVSVTVEVSEGAALAFTAIIDVLCEIARNVESEGGVVGHIKAFAREGDAFAHASVTAADLPPEQEGDCARAFTHGASIQFVAIALLVDLHDLEQFVQRALEAL